jgi:cytochrome c peroxidase
MQQLPPRRRTGEDPLFTDFTASNIGTPAHPLLPYYAATDGDRK